MKRINVNKNDDPSLIAEKIIDTKDDEIILTVPRFSKLADSLSNFHLLKREAEALDKKLVIESVDDRVIELAGISGIDSINPFFTKSKRRFSDIVVPDSKAKSEPAARPVKIRPVVMETAEKPEDKKKIRVNFSFLSGLFSGFSSGWKKYAFYGGLAAALLLGIFIVIFVLPRAEISILTKKVEWNYKDSVVADKNLAAADFGGAIIKIPAQLFTQRKNLSLTYLATGKKQVEKKAGGTMTIHNAYSSDPQPLVVNTRFESSDGKIFRLTEGVKVAGAKIIDGKIVPSTTEATVVADKAGQEYNIGPVEKFTIPGLKGSPKYNAFYGKSAAAMTGGFIGEITYPTPEDIKKAKEEISKQLEDSLRVLTIAQIPEDFKVIDGSSQYSVVKQEVMTEVDQSGKFSVLLTGEMSLLAFKEDMLKAALIAKGTKAVGDRFVIKDQDLKYLGQARLDLVAGKISFPVEFKGIYWPKIDVENLKQQVAGKSENDLKALIFTLPDVESAKVSLWPFWVSKVPSKDTKITVVVE